MLLATEGLRMSTVLPTEGTATLDQVAAAIHAGPNLLGVEDTAEFRAVLVRIGDHQAISFAAVLRVGWPSEVGDKPIVREAGGLTLVAGCFGASTIANKEHMIDVLNTWRPFGKYDVSLDFHDTVHIYRHESYSEWCVEPIWVLDLQEKTTGSLTHRGRSGPFFDPESNFFAEDRGDAARQWLGDPAIDQSSRLGIYKVAIRDRRAWLKNLHIDHDTTELTADLDRATTSKVFMSVSCTELDGKRTVQSTEVVGTSSRLALPLPLTAIRVFLTDATGEAYDGFGETAQYTPRGRASLLNPTPAGDPEYQELRDALEEGESETVEFKAWLPVDREKPKSYELLKAATAFANALGGVIYVGVTDDCVVLGTAQQLRTEFPNASTTNTEGLRKEYASTLRRVLNQGISPAPAFNIGWVTHAGLPILRIGILSKGALHRVVEDGAIYIRKAASDRKATPAEIEAIVARRVSPNKGLFPI